MSAGRETGGRAAPGPTQDEMQGRVDRLTALERAARAIATALSPDEERSTLAPVERIAADLASLRSHQHSIGAGFLAPDKAASESASIRQELLQTDIGLRELATSLRATVDAVALASLRAALPAASAERRDDVLALLELVLEDETGLERRLELLDYLTTLLSTEERGGKRIVARDPSSLTPRLRELGERIASTTAVPLPAVEREFIEAAKRCESGGFASVVGEMRARKAALGIAALAPAALRSIVYYNASVWSALQPAAPERPVRPPAATPRPAAAERASSTRGATPIPPVANAAAPPASATPAPRPAPTKPVPPALTSPATGARPEAPVGAPSPVATDDPEAAIRWTVDPNAGTKAAASLEGAEPHVSKLRSRLTAAFAGVAAAAGLAAWFFVAAPPNAATMLSAEELAGASPWVEAGYRDKARAGSLFIGTVSTSWLELPPDERKRKVQDVVAELERSGVREVMLYDQSQRLVVHHAETLPLQISL